MAVLDVRFAESVAAERRQNFDAVAIDSDELELAESVDGYCRQVARPAFALGAASPISAVSLGRLRHEPFDPNAIGDLVAGMCEMIGDKERNVGIGTSGVRQRKSD